MSYEDLLAEYERLKALTANCRSPYAPDKWRREQKKDYEQRLAAARPKSTNCDGSCSVQSGPTYPGAGRATERTEPRPPGRISAPWSGKRRGFANKKTGPAAGADSRRVRHPLPDHLETETVTIEPEEKICPCCGKPLERIGEEVSEEIDLIPAKLIRGGRFDPSTPAAAEKRE